MGEITGIASLKINDGKFEEFNTVAKQIVSLVSNEPGTLKYDWHIDEDAGTVRIIEVYRDSDAIVAHVTGEGAALFPALFETCTLTGIDLYGELTAAAKEATAPFGATNFGAPALSR